MCPVFIFTDKKGDLHKRNLIKYQHDYTYHNAQHCQSNVSLREPKERRRLPSRRQKNKVGGLRIDLHSVAALCMALKKGVYVKDFACMERTRPCVLVVRIARSSLLDSSGSRWHSVGSAQLPEIHAPGAILGKPYVNRAGSMAGGVPPYTWALVSGELPPGLEPNGGNGIISGTPTQVGRFRFAVEIRDSRGIGGAVLPFVLEVSGQRSKI